MALEGTYKELAAGYDLTKTVNGITATRQFIDSYPGADDSLPEMGDKLSETDEVLSSVVVTSVRETYYGNDCTQKLYIVSYSNTPGTSDNPDNPSNSDPDELPINGGLSGEAINIDGEKDEVKNQWVWKGTETPCNQQLFKTIVTGTYRITKRLANLELDLWAEYCGVINDGVFEGGGRAKFADGLVMFNGTDYEEYRNSKGERRYKVGFTFTIKKMRAFPGEAWVGWNYCFDPVDGKFKEVVNVDTNEPLYEQANLGRLLAGTEAP